MHIQKIRIERFKSFYEPYELDFNKVKGLWKVAGSVGSGKTTIGEAILFGLFGSISGKNNGDLVSWGQKSGIVELWCHSNGRNIYIKRDVYAAGHSTIYVEIDGEELIFTNKRDAQQQLENEYYDVSKVTMELLCIISFNNFKSLATLNTADTKKFLDQVLGFYTLTEYADACKQLKQENDSHLHTIKTNMSQLEAQIHKLNEMSNIEIIEGNIEDLTNLINEMNAEIAEVDKVFIEDKKKLAKQESDLKSESVKIKTLGSAKAKEIQFIEKGVCPTCGAAIDQSQLETKRQEREVLLDKYKSINEQINEVLEQQRSLVNDYNNAKIYRKPLNIHLSTAKSREQAKTLRF